VFFPEDCWFHYVDTSTLQKIIDQYQVAKTAAGEVNAPDDEAANH
jgi:hypothetical protein